MEMQSNEHGQQTGVWESARPLHLTVSFGSLGVWEFGRALGRDCVVSRRPPVSLNPVLFHWNE